MKIEKINQNNFCTSSKLNAQNKQQVQSYKNTTELPGGHKYSCAFRGYFGLGQNPDAPKTLEEFLSVYLQSGKKNAFKESGDNLYKLSSSLEELSRRKRFQDGTFKLGEFIDTLKNALSEPTQNDIPRNQEKTIEFKRKYLSELVETLENSEIDKNLQVNEIDICDICDNLADKMYLEDKKELEEYNKKIEEVLEYGKGEPITEFDLEEEFSKLPKEVQDKLQVGTDGTLQGIADKLIGGRSFAYFVDKENQDFETAALQTFPRYNSTHTGSKNNMELNFKYPPLYRLLSISDLDGFLEQFKIGEEYSYPVSQSCSKSKYGAEAAYYSASDNKFNVEFRIHPKSETSKAYDIASLDCNKATNYEFYDDLKPLYRTGEAIYPANAKFKVLGIHDYLESSVSNSDFNNVIKCSVTNPDHYKVLIDLQEV